MCPDRRLGGIRISVGFFSGEKRPDISGAEKTLLRLFAVNDIVHDKGLDWGDTKLTGQYFDSVLVRLFQSNHACEVATKEICNLDSDPVFNAQDYDDRGIKTEILKYGRGARKVSISSAPTDTPEINWGM